MAGGEQQNCLHLLEGGEGTLGIFRGNEDGTAELVDHGQVSGEVGSVDDGREDDVELDGENSS